MVAKHRCNVLFTRGLRPLQGQRILVGRGLATNILARWATIRSAHTCRISPVTRGLRPLQGQRIFLVAGLLPIYWPAGPQSARPLRAGKAPEGRHIGSTRIGAMFCLCAVGGPYRANVFLLGAGLLPIYWPAGPQSARPLRAEKAPEGRHIGSQTSPRQRLQSPRGATYR